MEPRKFISLPKILRRPRSKARVGPAGDPMEVDPAVSLHPTESTPDLGIDLATPGLSTPFNQESSGMQKVSLG